MSADLESFRTETRAWLEENCPQSMRAPMRGDDDVVWGGKKQAISADQRLWLDRMAERGWTTPTWPKDYGGGGLSKEEAKVLAQEMGRIKARAPLTSFGIWMLGPVLLEYATEEQKQRFIPPIVRGEIRWCQGYSEPGAGSDLAGLQTRAVDDGDHYVVNGQKVWTSYADQADWIFALVRTDTSVKHEGISFLLIDMESEGVSTKPIRLISGYSPFCETFFDDVRVPKENLVGKLNGGWEIAKRLLQYERQNISGFGGTLPRPVHELVKPYVGEVDGRIADPVTRDEVARHMMDAHAYALTVARTNEEAKTGGPSAATSMFKYYGAELNKKRFDLLMEKLGHQALGWEGDGFNEAELSVTRQWLRSKANSIEGGTTEVNLNVVAKRVLGLREHQ